MGGSRRVPERRACADAPWSTGASITPAGTGDGVGVASVPGLGAATLAIAGRGPAEARTPRAAPPTGPVTSSPAAGPSAGGDGGSPTTGASTTDAAVTVS